MAEVTVGPAGVDDVRALQRRRGVDDLTMRLSLELAERGTAWVARDDGDAIGIALCNDSEDERYLGDLFVEPSFRGQGIASRLLAAAFEDAADRSQTMALDVTDFAGVALALRRGLGHHETLLRLAGAIPKEEILASMAAGDYRFQVDAVDPLAHRFALDALDREVRGTARPDEHQRWSRDTTGQAFFVNGEFVGYAYVWPDGRIGPCATVSASYTRQLFAYAMVTLQRSYGASWCTLVAPSANARVARAGLRAGLRIEEAFVFASEGDGASLERYVAFHRNAF